jgi:HNH endonuclease
MAKRPLPSAERLRNLLDYDPETGVLKWKVRTDVSHRWNTRYAGTIAGTVDGDGYLQIKIDDKSMMAHRLAWVIYYGEWPNIVDHIDGSRNNNRISNLRSVTRKLNQRNQKRHKSNTSGRTGVTWNRIRQVWVAHIGHGKKCLYLGSYVEFPEAVKAREAAEQKLGFTGRQ